MRIACWVLLIFSLLSCKEQKAYVSKNENNGDPVYGIEAEDEAMNKAIFAAVKTYPNFISTLKTPDSTNSDFSVKMKFAYGDNGGHEHMWLTDLFFKEDKLYGVLDSEPEKITHVKAGDSIEIKKDSISDWMYVKNGKLVGGYTIKALYHKLNEEEKKRFQQDFPVKLE